MESLQTLLFFMIPVTVNARNISTFNATQFFETTSQHVTFPDVTTDKLQIEDSTFENMTGVGSRIPLYVGGLFSLSREWNGGDTYVAAEMALEHINAKEDILEGYELKMVWNDTGCYPGFGTRLFVDHLQSGPQKLLILGPPCSSNARGIAEISHYWNLITITYGALSTKLSERDLFPYFYRVNPSSISWGYAIIGLMQEFGWKRLGVFQQNSELYALDTENLIRRADALNVTIISVETINDDAKTPVTNMENLDGKIFYVQAFEERARKVFCEAYKQNMTGPGYVWIIYGWYSAQWWRNMETDSIRCSVKQMEEAIKSATLFYVDVFPFSARLNDTTISGRTPQELISELRERMNRPENLELAWTDYGFYAYDATWSVALMLNKSQEVLKEKTFANGEKRRLEDFTYDDYDMGRVFFDAMAETDFEGMSGRIIFHNGDRYGDCQIGYMKDLKKHSAARYSILENKFDWKIQIMWKDGHIPLDHTAIIREYSGIRLLPYLSLSTIAGFSVIFAAFVMIFNINYRNKRIVKMSSPNLNNNIIVGSMVIYVSVIVSGLDRNIASRTITQLGCQLRVWLLSTGFVLGFGSMFSKTWRVYRVAAQKVPTRRKISDFNLFSMVFVFFGFDVSILTLWQILDPIYVVEIVLRERFQRGAENPNQRIVTYTEQCSSDYQIYWLGILFGFKGLLLLFGTFLAWETRKVSIKGLNDSKQVGVCVYNTIVLCVIGVSVSFLINDDTETLFIFTSCIVIFCSTFTLVVIFVPKMILVYKGSDGKEEPSSASSIASMKGNGSRDQITHISGSNETLSSKGSTCSEADGSISERITPETKRIGGCGIWCGKTVLVCCSSPWSETSISGGDKVADDPEGQKDKASI